jgi:hypothetical protein
MMNLNYAIVLACTQTLISRWFEATSANTIFWMLFAPDIFDYDWESIEEEGEPLNFSQATAAHYWNYGELSLYSFAMVFALDWIFSMSLRNPWIIAIALFVGVVAIVEYIEAYPRQLILMFFTPWDEHRGEDLFIWYVDAIELGLYDPHDPPMSMFDNPAARDYLVS